jgi:hypothetical protein
MRSSVDCVLALLLFSVSATAAAAEAPYPPSPVIADMLLDWSTHQRHAHRQRQLPTDLGGRRPSVRLVGRRRRLRRHEQRRAGQPRLRPRRGRLGRLPGLQRVGRQEPENPAQFNGKSWGTICVKGVLYSWIVPDVPDTGGPRDHYRYIELAQSTDYGATWTKADWRWTGEDNLMIPTFLNFGKNNAGARDEFVYSYFIRPQYPGVRERGDDGHGLNVHKPGALFLARGHQDRIFESRDAYEWFTGTDGDAPTWGTLAGEAAGLREPGRDGLVPERELQPGAGPLPAGDRAQRLTRQHDVPVRRATAMGTVDNGKILDDARSIRPRSRRQHPGLGGQRLFLLVCAEMVQHGWPRVHTRLHRRRWRKKQRLVEHRPRHLSTPEPTRAMSSGSVRCHRAVTRP